jgi:hypothetical protein
MSNVRDYWSTPDCPQHIGDNRRDLVSMGGLLCPPPYHFETHRQMIGGLAPHLTWPTELYLLVNYNIVCQEAPPPSNPPGPAELSDQRGPKRGETSKTASDVMNGDKWRRPSCHQRRNPESQSGIPNPD